MRVSSAIYSTLDTHVDWFKVSRRAGIIAFGAVMFSFGAWTDSIYHGTAYLPLIREQAEKAPALAAAAHCYQKAAAEAKADLAAVDPVAAAEAAGTENCPKLPPVPPAKVLAPLVKAVR